MSEQVKVSLSTIQVIDGQGVSEGDLEMRVQVDDGSNSIVWPSANGSTKIDNKGAAHTINKSVGTYTIANGSLTKQFDVDLTEVDLGLNGKDDQGHGSVTFTLTPSMGPTTKYATIELHRPRQSKANGKVKVGLRAEAL